MKNSVIVCTRNRVDDLKKCLNSLLTQTVLPDEIVLVDSSDVPLEHDAYFADIIKQKSVGGVAVQYAHVRPGLTYQRNVGIDKATGAVLYFFDDDVVLEPTYLQVMHEIFSNNPDYAGGMGTITNIPAKVVGWQRSLRSLFLLQRDYASGRFTFSGMPTHAYGNTQFQRVEVLGGCCMAYRRAALSANRFDERLVRYAYMEDCDVSARVAVQAPLFYEPRARLAHYNSPLARDKVVDNRAMFIKNYSYLFFKNFYPRQRIRLVGYLWSVGGLFLEALLIRNPDYIKGYLQGLRQFLRGQ